MNPTLVVLAGGRARRFGRSKQVEPVGPNGETLIQYSIHDALRCGFQQVVVVVSPGNEEIMRHSLSDVPTEISVSFAVQDAIVPGRHKPLGTAHALLSARSQINEAFVVLNADDYYGPGAFQVAANFLQSDQSARDVIGLLSYELSRTIHNDNAVSRALCELDSDSSLKSLTELSIRRDAKRFVAEGDAVGRFSLTGDERVSMNCWTMTPAILDLIDTELAAFLQDPNLATDGEFLLPEVLQLLSASDRAVIELLKVSEDTFGLSFESDKADVAARLARAHESGTYSTPLWSASNNSL